MKIVVIDGTGLIGWKLVEKLGEAGHELLAASPESGVDTLTGHGARGHRILRLADDPQDYMVIIEFASFGGAQGFREEPLLLRAIDAAGIEGGAHHVQYVEEFREQLEAVDYTW